VLVLIAFVARLMYRPDVEMRTVEEPRLAPTLTVSFA
jgi:hypothetical protein